MKYTWLFSSNFSRLKRKYEYLISTVLNLLVLPSKQKMVQIIQNKPDFMKQDLVEECKKF